MSAKAPDILAQIRSAASNLERYPFMSATMAEAGRLAANVLRNIADSHSVEAGIAWTPKSGGY